VVLHPSAWAHGDAAHQELLVSGFNLFQVDYHEQLVENYLWININHFCNIHDWN
jgi:hypothetical protein